MLVSTAPIKKALAPRIPGRVAGRILVPSVILEIQTRRLWVADDYKDVALGVQRRRKECSATVGPVG